MDEGLRGNFTPVRFLSLADDLNGLAYCAVAVCPSRGHIHPMVVTCGALGVLR
jgi:hypothetical protein